MKLLTKWLWYFIFGWACCLSAIATWEIGLHILETRAIQVDSE